MTAVFDQAFGSSLLDQAFPEDATVSTAVYPDQEDVRSGVLYGPNGTDYEGSLTALGTGDDPDDIDPHVTGDTFMGKTFSVTDQNGDAVNLTGATITMQFRNGKRLVATMTLSSGLSVVSASGGTFKIDEQVIDWDAPMVVSFDAEVVTSGGDTITAASGRWPILADITVPS